MFKTLLFAACSLTASYSFSQADLFEKSLDSIQTETDAQQFLEKNKSAKGKVITFNKEKHHTRLAKELFSMSVGGKKFDKNSPQRTYYKVIDKTSTPYYKASCIYLDGNETDLNQINATRNNIISKYNKGFKFSDLARMYSMDQTAKKGGDLGWVTQGDLPIDIETQLFSGDYHTNDIFTVDIPEQEAYYVVVLTQDRKLIEEVKVLKVTEPRL
ncbi:peptidylprolyl isomerase [Sediminibacter sp. Hel_I_10]|uniref:peptidylprolyl isomerase n=1 Tax=Sediminibacter sp. Hel_I_10 TaxID=1392490 RepID=UPI00047942F8|nr:peptidylprolyl isomerase [Sediminibacter sp. Hel_I_10]